MLFRGAGQKCAQQTYRKQTNKQTIISNNAFIGFEGYKSESFTCLLSVIAPCVVYTRGHKQENNWHFFAGGHIIVNKSSHFAANVINNK